jgi:hypothetical protein
MFDFFSDPLEDKIVCVILSRRSFCALQLSASTAFWPSISGLATKRLTSTLNDIIYHFLVILIEIFILKTTMSTCDTLLFSE